jgi:hypothetical protein
MDFYRNTALVVWALAAVSLAQGTDSLSDEEFIQNLRNAAYAEANVESAKEAETTSTVFKGAERSQQALNPEISVVGDFLAKARLDAPYSPYSTPLFRVAGIHFESDLDPFSHTKITVGAKPGGAEVGEAYIVWSGLVKSMSFTVGKIRQQFGVVNRWHVPSLDQVMFPLAMTTILGEEGLNQTGLSVDWMVPPLWAHSNELKLEVTGSDNKHLFSGAGNHYIPCGLLHLNSYYDLTRNTYLEFGVTGLGGVNSTYADEQTQRGVPGERRYTFCGGADLTVLWEPVDRRHYTHLVWRSEFYFARKEVLNNSVKIDTIEAYGAYSYLQKKWSERIETGMRFDYTTPFRPDNSGLYLLQITPYLTFWQSPWVKLRLEYHYGYDEDTEEDNHDIVLQMTWAAGPHKHERY